MKANHKESASLTENTKENQSVDESRRSFAKVGAVLAPVVMTLANRPAWAAREMQMCTTSGIAFQSYFNQGQQVSYTAIFTRSSDWKSPAAWLDVNKNERPVGYRDNGTKSILEQHNTLAAYNRASDMNQAAFGNFPSIFLDGGAYRDNLDANALFYSDCTLQELP